jgi:hypothetical protein
VFRSLETDECSRKPIPLHTYGHLISVKADEAECLFPGTKLVRQMSVSDRLQKLVKGGEQ